MSVERAPEAGTSGSSVKVTGASIDNLSERDASERHVPVMHPALSVPWRNAEPPT